MSRNPDAKLRDAQHRELPAIEAQGLGDILPYVVPMFAYVALSGLESYLPQANGLPIPVWYAVAYTIKLAAVVILACWYRSTWADLRPFPTAGGVLLAAAVGLLVTLVWVGLEGLYPPLPRQLSGGRVGFDPRALMPVQRWSFVGIRMLGLVVAVPLIEELFWRSFLIRWLIDPDFKRVPIGRLTPMAAVVTSVLFALIHPEWLPALLTGLAWAGLLGQTKSLSACVISHAVANLFLGVYVIVSGDWKYW
jgi:CAAX prenyl protease-like protein